MEENNHKAQNWIIAIFLLIPIAASIVSLIHSIDFLDLGNDKEVSIAVAVLYELTLLACLVALSMAQRVKKSIIWATIIVLTIIQVIGNTFYSYSRMTLDMASDSQALMTVIEFLRLKSSEPADAKLILSVIIGAPVPLISFAFLKAFADYINSFINSVNIYEGYDDYYSAYGYGVGDTEEDDKSSRRGRRNRNKKYEELKSPIIISGLNKDDMTAFRNSGKELFGIPT